MFWHVLLGFPKATLPTWWALLAAGCLVLWRAALFFASCFSTLELFLLAGWTVWAELSEVCPEAIPVPVTLLTRQISPFNRAQVCVMLEQTERQPIYISQVLTGVWLASQKMCFFKCCLFQEAGLLAASAASSMRQRVWRSGRWIQVRCPFFTSLIISVVKPICFHCVPVKGGKSPSVTLWLRDTDSACYQEVCLQLQFGWKLQHRGQSHCIWFALELLLCLCYFPLLTPMERKKQNKTTHKTHALSRLWWILFTLIMYYTKRN